MKSKIISIAGVVILVGVLIALALLSIKGPTQTAAPSQATCQAGKPFRMIGTNQEVPVVKIMIAGFLTACKDHGLNCVMMGVDGNDIAKSVQMAEQSVALGSSGLLTTIYDKAWYGPTRSAIAAGIPVINGHFPMDKSLIPGMKGWVAPDNVGYAKEAAKAMGEKIGCKGKVAITQSTLSDGENAVSKGFTDQMKTTCPSVTVMTPQIETTDPDKALSVAGTIMLANTDLTGAFSTTGGGATAWAKAAKELKWPKGKLIIIGMDASRENLDLLKEGDVYALVAQPLYEEMYQAVVLLYHLCKGMPVPYANELPAPVILAKDIGYYYEVLKKAEAIK